MKICNLFTHGAARSLQELVQKSPCIFWNWSLEGFFGGEGGGKVKTRIAGVKPLGAE